MFVDAWELSYYFFPMVIIYRENQVISPLFTYKLYFRVTKIDGGLILFQLERKRNWLARYYLYISFQINGSRQSSWRLLMDN